jgi:hypothetical protein
VRYSHQGKTNIENLGRIHIEITADVNIAAPVARRLVNTELMKKVGQMLVAGDPELLVEGDKIYWKVPIMIVPPLDGTPAYPSGKYALVNAISGLYSMTKEEVKEIESASEPILQRLYPNLDDWVEQVRAQRKSL